MRSLQWIVQAFLGASFALAVVGCGGSGGSGTATSKPKIRVINASPDSNPVEVQFTTVDLEAGLAYLDTSSVFHEKKADTYDVAVFDSVTSDSLWSETTTVANDKKYLVVTYGLENYGTETIKRLRTAEFVVDLTSPVGNKAKLIVFHAFNRGVGFDTPAIDFQNPGDNPQYALANITFGGQQSITVDSGNSLTFDVRRNGTQQVYASTTPNLDAGGVYLALVSGVEGAVSPQDPRVTFFKLN